MIDAGESECLGVVAFTRDWNPGEVIPRGRAGVPVLAVELAD
jgi:hypothetical protein